MAYVTFDLLIIYHDELRKIIRSVSNYGITLDNPGCFYYEKNGYRSFVPVDKVRFFGRLFDYEEE